MDSPLRLVAHRPRFWGDLTTYMKYSVTLAGLITAAAGYLAQLVNVSFPFTNDDIEKAITIIITLGGLLIAAYGRLRKGDIKFPGFKK